MSSASIATRLQRPDQALRRSWVHGASTTYHESAISDHMKTFTEDVDCLATIVSKGIDCL